MADAYKHDPDGVAAVVTSLNGILTDYNGKITELKSLVNKINDSSSWKDLDVKSAFITTCNSYLKIYESLASSMEKYISYLNGKSGSAEELENAFKR